VNVTRSATAPKNNTEEVKPLTRAEVKRLLDTARGIGSRPCTSWPWPVVFGVVKLWGLSMRT
jgi:hypothetical protein